MHNTQQDTVGEPEIRFIGMSSFTAAAGGLGGGGVYGEINQILFPSHILRSPSFGFLPFSLSCLQTRRRRANVINSQMELSLLSDGLVKPFPEEEVRELGGGGHN